MSTKLKFASTVSVLLASLSFSSKIQAREELNKEAVADYTDLAKAAKAKGADFPLPALDVVKRNGEFLVVSGFTRGRAAKNAEYVEVPVRIAEADEATDAELFAYAVEANQGHGVRLTNADKLHNLLRTLKFPGVVELSNIQIGELAGVSEFFVRKNRPASANPAVKTVTNKKTGKKTKVDTSRIGKKGGKSKPAAKKKESKSESTKGGDKEKKVSDSASRNLTRICSLIDGKNGLSGKSFREAVESGALPLSEPELKAFAETSDGRVLKIAPLVIEKQWKPTKAIALIDKPVDASTKVEHLLNLATVGGGVVTPSFGHFGEKVEGTDNIKVLAWDTTKFDVTVTPKK